jgi:hypothetical protein
MKESIMSNILNSLITAAGCSIAAALTIGASMSTGGTQGAMPASEWRSLLDQRVAHAPCHEPLLRRPASTTIVPIGIGWG